MISEQELHKLRQQTLAKAKQRQAQRAARAKQRKPNVHLGDELYGFEPDSTLINDLTVELAIRCIRYSLSYAQHSHSEQFQHLMSLPAGRDLYFAEPTPCISLAFRVDGVNTKHDKLNEQLVLAELLPTLLPGLADAFDNKSGLDEIWLLAVQELMANPLPDALLDEPLRTHRAYLVESDVQARPSNQATTALSLRNTLVHSVLLAKTRSYLQKIANACKPITSLFNNKGGQ